MDVNKLVQVRKDRVNMPKDQLKREDLEKETAIMWGMETGTIVMFIGALRLMRECLNKFTNKVQSNINIHEIRNNVLCGTAYIHKRVPLTNNHLGRALGPSSGLRP